LTNRGIIGNLTNILRKLVDFIATPIAGEIRAMKKAFLLVVLALAIGVIGYFWVARQPQVPVTYPIPEAPDTPGILHPIEGAAPKEAAVRQIFCSGQFHTALCRYGGQPAAPEPARDSPADQTGSGYFSGGWKRPEP
jgi:hypothetical protein